MRNTSKKAAKKRTPKHPQKTRPVKPESYIQTVSRMLTVRRMFSLLHYRVILARKGPNVKDFFLSFSEYSAPGLGIVDSGQLGCRIAKNWEFARRAGGQVVRKICVIVFALRRSVSFCGAVNWEFVEFSVIANPNSRSLRTSPQTGVAIPRIDVPLFVNESRETAD